MATISLIEDYNQIAPVPGTDCFVVNSVADYAKGYEALVKAIYARKALTIVVRNRAVWHWYKQAVAKYGENYFQLVTYSYRHALAQKWNMAIPDWVSDRDIQMSGLLSMDIFVSSGQSFQEIILSNIFSPLMFAETFPCSRLVELLEARFSDVWHTELQKPLFKKIFDRKINAWRDQLLMSGSSEWRKIYELLIDDPRLLLNCLITFKVLRSYPKEYGIRLLGDLWTVILKASPDVTDVLIQESELGDIKAQLMIYFKKVIQTEGAFEETSEWSETQAEDLLSHLSGTTIYEFESYLKVLEAKKVSLTRNLVRQIRVKFKPIQSRIGSKLVELEQYIQPAKPDVPVSNWEPERWLQWATEEYLPYRFWLEETGKYDDEINKYANLYERWLGDNFLNIRSHYSHVVYRLLLNTKSNLLPLSVNIFIIIDNFNYKYAGLLQDQFAAKGYLLQGSSIPYFSMLPSETEISKKCLIAGEPEPKDLPKGSYEALIEKAWKEHFTGISMMYLASLKQMSGIDKLEHEVYFLNYLPIDKTYHSDESETGLPHRESIRIKLEALVNNVDEFAKKHQVEEKLNIFICSDHGSTKISQEYPNLINKDFYKNKVISPGHRFVEISDSEIDKLPDAVAGECHILNRKKYGLKKNYLIARGYSRFEEIKETVYVHGGLLPEETIVPFLQFRRSAWTLQKPVIKLINTEFRYAVKSVILLDVSNLNQFALTNINLAVITNGIEATPLLMDSLEAHSAETLEIKCRIPQSLKGIDKIEICFEADCGNKHIREVHSFAITMKQMMTTSIDFDF